MIRPHERPPRIWPVVIATLVGFAKTRANPAEPERPAASGLAEAA